MYTKRSYLFVPGTSLKMIEKALGSEADSVIIDLEDAVAINEKKAARETAVVALQSNCPKKDVYIRINDITTPLWREDLIAAIDAGAIGIIVPKAESAGNMKFICQTALEHFEKKNKNGNLFEVLPLIETARGIHCAYDIASSHFLIPRLVFGSIDFSLDVDCQLTEQGDELLYARSQIVIASKAAGVGSPVDAVYPGLGNEQGLKSEALRSRQLGFRSKLAIHPKQLDPIHDVHTPSQKEVEEAMNIVKVFELAEHQGCASISIGEKFVDYPVYKKAKTILQYASL
ncbi:CoA ester lyase [Peribacillus cavernae]|uniref:CoA ester lyase n=1 Tax=Peribacillus cavernae TaxID=1674310 RepID=A0A3S0UAN3_9BACI|nr:CoA ester lyase [Peribacillus cavernae]MDQ0219508.1 citrate lyase subunit beta/citryl-CoA lyase [Peribacillus cavernae]RUQ27076.1 CoA ester lyase [Peribacillus cavernae]